MYLGRYLNTRKRTITKICKQLKEVTYPQEFTRVSPPDINSMAYAVGIKIPEPNWSAQIFYYPGGICYQQHCYTGKIMMRLFVKDMKTLGIKAFPITKEQAMKENRCGIQTVGFFYSEAFQDFQFIRKDKDGTWSRKRDFMSYPEKINYNYEEDLEGEYDLIGFFNLSF